VIDESDSQYEKELVQKFNIAWNQDSLTIITLRVEQHYFSRIGANFLTLKTPPLPSNSVIFHREYTPQE
jgi:hypothetical protein